MVLHDAVVRFEIVRVQVLGRGVGLIGYAIARLSTDGRLLPGSGFPQVGDLLLVLVNVGRVDDAAPARVRVRASAGALAALPDSRVGGKLPQAGPGCHAGVGRY